MSNAKATNDDNDFLDKLIVGIGEVSEITGIPQRQIRYWEAKGYIASVKGKISTRRYDYKTIKRMLLVKELLDEGYTLESSVSKVDNRLKLVDDAIRKLKNKKTD